MFTKTLYREGHVRLFTVSDLGRDGWQVQVLQDSAVVRQTCYTDWHRVERALSVIEREVQDLQRDGWREDAVGDVYSTKR